MHVHSDAPSPWIVRFAHLIPAGARVLDLACGAGRHARFLASRGCRVIAVDRDATSMNGLANVAGVDVRVADLEAAAWPFAAERFGAIVVANYLHRPLLPHITAALAPDGVLLYETFATGNARFGKPSRPAFLLQGAELLATFGASMTVVAFEQGEVQGVERCAVVQRFAAVGSARQWPPVLEPTADRSA